MPLLDTVPFAGCVTDETAIGPPSTSVSLVSTKTIVTPESSPTVVESLTATGLSSMDVTWTLFVSEPLRVVSSVTLNVTVRSRVDGLSEGLAYVTSRSAAW